MEFDSYNNLFKRACGIFTNFHGIPNIPEIKFAYQY